MPKRTKKSSSKKSRLFFRICCGGEIALGPGKVQLLKLIQEKGSIVKAAAEMEMSYMRAWGMIGTMNRWFKEPVVEAERGGTKGGGAKVTAAGVAIIKLYEQLERDALAAARPAWQQLETMIKGHPVVSSSK